MALFEIQKLGSPILREKAAPVTRVDDTIRRLLDDMAETMYDANGVGLAAPQIGVAKRVIVVDAGEGLIALVNPVFVKGRGSDVQEEGCLSIPNYYASVPRFKSAVVKGLDREGREVIVKAKNFTARALQHEIDHLDGILFIDKMIEVPSEEEIKGQEQAK